MNAEPKRSRGIGAGSRIFQDLPVVSEMLLATSGTSRASSCCPRGSHVSLQVLRRMSGIRQRAPNPHALNPNHAATAVPLAKPVHPHGNRGRGVSSRTADLEDDLLDFLRQGPVPSAKLIPKNRHARRRGIRWGPHARRGRAPAHQPRTRQWWAGARSAVLSTLRVSIVLTSRIVYTNAECGLMAARGPLDAEAPR